MVCKVGRGEEAQQGSSFSLPPFLLRCRREGGRKRKKRWAKMLTQWIRVLVGLQAERGGEHLSPLACRIMGIVVVGSGFPLPTTTASQLKKRRGAHKAPFPPLPTHQAQVSDGSLWLYGA